MKRIIDSFKPRNGANTANVLLLGQISAGKSSFVNSVDSIYRGKISSKACIGSFGHSVTIKVNRKLNKFCVLMYNILKFIY